MYLHLSREISIPAGDIVAIINLNGHPAGPSASTCAFPWWLSTGYRKGTGAAWSSRENRSLPCRSRGKRWSGVIRSACARQGMYSKMFEFKV